MQNDLKLRIFITCGILTAVSCQLDFNFFNTTQTLPEESTNETTTTREANDELYWVPKAVTEVAYYLRQHKFNEFDRRYYHNSTNAPVEYFSEFPRPPLRSLHWEVHLHCDLSFISCLEYLWKKVKLTGLRRDDDTSVIIVEQNWTKETHLKQIVTTEEDCQKLRKSDDVLANPFQGPIERFQWRTTGAYYMCWYTMNEVPSLKHFHEESCDNFAYCLSRGYGARTDDYRVNDQIPFSCAIYSFCPDPCCPLKHYDHEIGCLNSDLNPCFEENPIDHRLCIFPRHENTDFRDAILNRWNVSCECQRQGFRWDSFYSICVDINECTEKTHNCNTAVQACLNLPGSFMCACKWGFIWNDNKICVEDPVVKLLRVEEAEAAKELKKKEKMAKSLFKYIYEYWFPTKDDD